MPRNAGCSAPALDEAAVLTVATRERGPLPPRPGVERAQHFIRAGSGRWHTVEVASPEPTNGEFCELGWTVYAVMLAGSVAVWVMVGFLFGVVDSVAGAAFNGMVGGLAMCATVRWRARRGGRWRRSRTQ